MRIVAIIDQAEVSERILRHLGLWEAGVRVDSAPDPPEPDEPISETTCPRSATMPTPLSTSSAPKLL